MREGFFGNTIAVALRPLAALTSNKNVEALGQSIDDTASDAVESAGYRISAAAKLSSRVESSQNYLNGGNLLDRVNIDRDSSPVVRHPHPAISEHHHINVIAVPGECFVDRVVDDLIDQVVEPSRPRRTDIHTGSFANSLQSFEDLNIACAVGTFVRSVFRRFGHVGCLLRALFCR